MRFVAMDTETTGGSRSDRIIEIGMSEMIDFRMTGRRFHSFVRAPVPIHWAARRVHGISDSDLINAPVFRDIARDVLDFIGDDLMIAHNAKFDNGMIHKEWEELEIPHAQRPQMICSMPIAGKYARGSVKLDNLISEFLPDEQQRGKHSAIDDAELLGRVLVRMNEIDPDRMRAHLRGVSVMSNGVRRQVVPKVSKPRTRPARPAGETARLNPGVAEEIARANASGDVEIAAGIRTGRDSFTLMRPEQLIGSLSRDAVEACRVLPAPAHILSALRMVARGLRPDLAVARQEIFVQKDAERNSPSPDIS